MINIVNYRVGNLQNIQNAFSTLGVSSQIVDNPEELKTAEKIVLPGVGSFGYCMQMIKKYNFDEIIKEKIKQGKILLGICVGMQVLFEWGLEKGEHRGLGILKGKVVKLQSKYKIPQVGWNKVFFKDTSKIYKPHKTAWFYFVHSYHCIPEDKKIIFASCNYDQKIVSIIQKENLWGTQFHPEKSQQDGLNFLTQFANCIKDWQIELKNSIHLAGIFLDEIEFPKDFLFE